MNVMKEKQTNEIDEKKIVPNQIYKLRLRQKTLFIYETSKVKSIFRAKEKQNIDIL